MELENLTTEELKVIALEKDKIGNASRRARKAQIIIWDRSENPIRACNFNSSNRKKYTSSDYSYLM